MTEGRFDCSATYARNQKWHQRDFFTKHNTQGAKMFKFAEREMMEKESCPFHDLRADGCFQPVHAEYGDPGVHIEPDQLMKRKGLQGFRTGNAGWKDGKFAGMGGSLLPLEVAPPKEQASLKRKCDGRPWGGGKGPALFSTYPYIAAPPGGAGGAGTGGPGSGNLGGLGGGPLKPFRSGGESTWKDRPVHMPDNASKPKDRAPFRLKSGKVQPLQDSRLTYLPQGSLEGPKGSVRNRSAPAPPVNTRGVFKNPVSGTFNKPAHHLPDPEPSGAIRSYRPPMFTYHAHAKRSMPVSVPWETGTKQAQAERGD